MPEEVTVIPCGKSYDIKFRGEAKGEGTDEKEAKTSAEKQMQSDQKAAADKLSRLYQCAPPCKPKPKVEWLGTPKIEIGAGGYETRYVELEDIRYKPGRFVRFDIKQVYVYSFNWVQVARIICTPQA